MAATAAAIWAAAGQDPPTAPNVTI